MKRIKKFFKTFAEMMKEDKAYRIQMIYSIVSLIVSIIALIVVTRP